MKLLFDQNLSHKLTATLAVVYPGSAHVRDFGLERVDDDAIWAFARDGGFTIVSKDDDFHQRSFVYGAPPKVIWLRCGNCSTARIVECLMNRSLAIRAFHDDPAATFLALS